MLRAGRIHQRCGAPDRRRAAPRTAGVDVLLRSWSVCVAACQETMCTWVNRPLRAMQEFTSCWHSAPCDVLIFYQDIRLSRSVWHAVNAVWARDKHQRQILPCTSRHDGHHSPNHSPQLCTYATHGASPADQTQAQFNATTNPHSTVLFQQTLANTKQSRRQTHPQVPQSGSS